jgi:hypothetical protein
VGRCRRRRAGVERERELPQDRREPLLKIRDRPVDQKALLALRQRPLQTAADQGAVEDEGSAHGSDMAVPAADPKRNARPSMGRAFFVASGEACTDIMDWPPLVDTASRTREPCRG